MNTVSPIILLVLILLGIVLMILWICLPFALFGIKGRLDKIIKLMERERAEKERAEPRL